MIRPVNTCAVDPPARRRPIARKAATFKKADLSRAIAAVKAGGLFVATVEIRLDGTIALGTSDTSSSPDPSGLFDQWKAKL